MDMVFCNNDGSSRTIAYPFFIEIKIMTVLIRFIIIIFTLTPEKRKYFARGQVTTETAIHASALKDIYMTIGDQLDDGSWIVNIQFNVFIRWIWFSATMMVLAGLFLTNSLSRSRS